MFKLLTRMKFGMLDTILYYMIEEAVVIEEFSFEKPTEKNFVAGNVSQKQSGAGSRCTMDNGVDEVVKIFYIHQHQISRYCTSR